MLRDLAFGGDDVCAPLALKRDAQLRRIAIAANAPKAPAGLNERRAHPAKKHLAVAPAPYVPAVVRHRPVEVLDGIGAAQGAQKRPLDAQAKDGEGLLQALAQRGGRSRASEPARRSSWRRASSASAQFQASFMARRTLGRSLSGRCSRTLRSLWTWQR